MVLSPFIQSQTMGADNDLQKNESYIREGELLGKEICTYMENTKWGNMAFGAGEIS